VQVNHSLKPLNHNNTLITKTNTRRETALFFFHYSTIFFYHIAALNMKTEMPYHIVGQMKVMTKPLFKK